MCRNFDFVTNNLVFTIVSFFPVFGGRRPAVINSND